MILKTHDLRNMIKARRRSFGGTILLVKSSAHGIIRGLGLDIQIYYYQDLKD